MKLLRIFLLSVLSIASCDALLMQTINSIKHPSLRPLHSYLALKLHLEEHETLPSSPSKMRCLKFVQLSYQTEPGLLADYLIELGAFSVSVTDHDLGTDLEIPIFAEPNMNNDEYAAIICGDSAVGKNGEEQDNLFESWGDLKNCVICI
jgi:hypothetical protein